MRAVLCLSSLLIFAWACDDGSGDADGGGDGGGDGGIADARLPGDAGASATDGGEGDVGPGDLGALQGPTPNFDGRVMGHVHGVDASNRVALVEAAVWLQTADGRARGAAVRTDRAGRYEIGPAPLGLYRVCAGYGGAEPVCSDPDIEITVDSPYIVRPIEIALRGAVVGRVEYADGSPCVFGSAAHDLDVRGTANLGETIVVTNERGDFVLAPLPAPGDYTLVGACGDATIGLPWTVTAAHLVGPAERAILRTGNTPPELGAMAFVNLGEGPARHPRAGDRVRIDLQATDVDDDPVTISLVDEAGEAVVAVDGAFEITAPDRTGQLLFTAVASDGQGGYSEARGVLRVGDRPARLSGEVLDGAGAPIVGAQVFIGRTRAETDAVGRFRLLSALADSYRLTVSAEGFVTQQFAFDAESSRLSMRLQATTDWVVSPFEEHTLQDEAGRAQVHLPAGAVPAQGRAEPITVAIAGYDPQRPVDFPGERLGVDLDGNTVTLDLLAALAVEIRAEDGRALAMGRGQTAQIYFPAPPARDGEVRPAGLPLFAYDRAARLWRQEGMADLIDDAYVADVTHFSEWSVGQAFLENEACMRVDVPLEMLGQFRLRFAESSSSVHAGAVIGEWIPTQTINVVRNLRHNTAYEAQLVSLTDPPQIIDWYSARTDGPPFNRFIGFPYTQGNEGCFSPLRVKPYLPGFGWFLNRFEGDFDSSWDYYNRIGYDRNTTLTSWKQLWGFTPQDEANAVGFYNPQEFGLGRRGTCHTRGSTVDDLEMACCVAKYGHVGGDRIEALEDTIADTHVGDTVCMEYSAGPGPERIVKFLAFKASGELSASTVFDTDGEKFVPEVCGHCHGRTQDWETNGADQGGRFVFFDAPAYEYANWDPRWTKAAQEERLRELNRLVKMTHGDTGVYADYIDSLYRDGVETVGAVSNEPAVLAAWQDDAQTFQNWVRPNCRTCHIWQSLDLAEPAELGTWVSNYICDGTMPNAMQPMLNVWSRLDPFPGDAIINAFGGTPCFSTDAPPSLQILEPADNTDVQMGGILGLRFRAQADDAEDGPDCCAITWTSDKDGVLGYGPSINSALTRPGIHTITATARDSRYRSTRRSVSVRALNDPPRPEVRFPAMDNDLLFRGVPYVVRGVAVDANQPLGLPCGALRWSSSNPTDAFPFNACHRDVVFDSNGPRALTLRALDAQGASVEVQRIVNVADPPLNAPPIVTILEPVQDTGVPGEVASDIRFSVVDPDEDAVVQWVLYAKTAQQADDRRRVLAQGECQPGAVCRPTRRWTPRDEGFLNCGGLQMEISVEATDPNGTGIDRVTFSAGFPPC